ncbi:MAG TPA: helix-turn-helix transcriptional regulator [Vicinamibacterales bacterium]|nr:helix-turn-helix transcriptional regulator [Vicinamibacterales bacterium]
MRVHLGEFEQVLLLALARLDEDASSLDVRACIEARAGRTVSPGAIYTAFQRLERRGFVATSFGEPTPQRGGKRKKLYRLRPAGVRALQDMQSALGGLARGLKPRVLSR